MQHPSSIRFACSYLLLLSGVALCAVSMVLALSRGAPGSVDIEANHLEGMVLNQDEFHTDAIHIINRTGKRIWLYNQQGWG
ncbi:MAG TPA: hypothetical protein VMP01_14825 [Pirellulaceae bacterium]|nr:hypothetical protein [Pirellulaceae bacterium]